MRFLALVVLVLLGGCAGAAKPDPKTPESIVRDQAAALALVDAANGEKIKPEALFAQLRTKRVVYVAERHDQAVDHAVQYSLLQQLHREESSLAIGMEMFQVPFQEALVRWSNGQIDETVLRRDTEYDQRWGFDFSMYRPMLEYARGRGLEVVALNAPQEVTRQIAKDGLAGLSPEDSSALPDLDLGDPKHRALFDAEFGTEEHDAGDAIERYYEAQVVWDETMATRVAETLERSDGPAKMIVFAGRVHVKRGLGIPDRAARRGAAPYAVVMPVTEEELEVELKLAPEDRSADFFWGVQP